MPETREPKRLQQKRTRGFKLPPGARSVARPSKYGNPFTVHPADCVCHWEIHDPHSIAQRCEDYPERFSSKAAAVKAAVELYELHTGPMGAYELDVEEVRRDLTGRDLACWCPLPEPGEVDYCHARVLLEIVNGADDA